MGKFIEGDNRYQTTLFPEQMDDFVAEDSPVRVVDVFIDRLDISGLGFKAEPSETGRPGYDLVFDASPRLTILTTLMHKLLASIQDTSSLHMMT